MLKGQKVKSDYMDWDQMNSLVLKLERDGEYKFALMIGVNCRIGLRITDLLTLTWNDLLGKERFELTERKTGKTRVITLHEDLQELVNRIYRVVKPKSDDYMFPNQNGDPLSIQYINKKLKKVMQRYKISGRYSSHFMRKTMGRRIFHQNKESEKALIILSYLFNHSSINVTRVYLGIRQREIDNLYLTL